MTFFIPHHGFSQLVDPAIVADRENNIEFWASAIEDKPNNVDLGLSTIYMDALYNTAGDPDVAHPETWDCWVASMQIQHAMFIMSRNTRETHLQFLIYHKVRHTKGIGPFYAANASNWLDAFFLTCVCRDVQRRKELCEIPVEFLKECGESQGTEYNPFVYYWVSALQALVLNRPGLGEDLLTAMELSDPDRADFGDADSLNMITFPQLNTLLRLAEGDKDKFNQALAEGIGLYREYWTSDEDRIKMITSTIPLGLLALACIAHDSSHYAPNFTLEVESGYLPKYLVNGAWHGDTPI